MKKGKRLVSIVLGMALVLQPFSGIGPVKAADEVVIADTFPDAKFRAYVTDNFDKDKDGNLSADEIADVVAIDVSKENVVKNMTGIGVFTNLLLLDCSGQALTSLDVTGLEKLVAIDASSNLLSSFVLPKNAPNLNSVNINSNQITTLTSLANYEQLQKLDVGYNNLKSLDLSQLSELTYLDVSRNVLTTLDLSTNSKLETLICKNMTALSELDLTTTENVDHKSLKKVDATCISSDSGKVTRGAIIKVDVSGDDGLNELKLSNNSISTLNIEGATALKTIDVSSNKLTALDITKHTQLESLDASSNDIKSLDVTNNKELKVLELSSMALGAIDVTQNVNLEELDLSHNELSQIDVSKNTALGKLNLASNQLQRIDVENNTRLTQLNLDKNHLVAIDITNCLGLKGSGAAFSCGGNTRNIELTEDNFDFNLGELVDDGFVKEIERGIDRGEDYVGDACIQVKKTKNKDLVSTVEGGEIDAFYLLPSVDSKTVKYNYYYGLGNGTVQFTLNIVNPLTIKVWARSEGEQNILDDKDANKVRVGGKITLIATDAAKNELPNVTWSSSDEKAIQVDAKTGELALKEPGEARIYVNINQRARGYISLKTHYPVVSVKLVDNTSADKKEYSDSDIIEMEAGTCAESAAKIKTFTARCYNYKGDVVDSEYSGLTYKVTDAAGKETSNVIICNSEGRVSARGAGIAYLHCVSKDSGVESVIQFNVTRRVDEVTATNTKLSMFTGDTKRIIASVSPATATNQKLRWETSNNTIADVDEDGNITAKGEGSAEITCTSVDNPAAFQTIYVTVTPAANGVSLDYTKYELVLGGSTADKSVKLEATIEADDVTAYQKTWTTSNAEVATVNAEGLVTAKKAGEAVIKCAVSDTKYAVCKITVVQRVTSISSIVDAETFATIGKISLNVNQTKTIKANISPENATNPKVTWTSSDESVATISADGVIRALKKGTTNITCKTTDGSERIKEITLSVKLPAAQLTVDKESIVVYVNRSQRVTATVLPEAASDKSLLWESGNSDVARVSSGNITGVSAGTTTIKCTTRDGSNLTKEIRVTVLQQITSISLNQTSADMIAGKTLALKATIKPASVNNAGLIWTSSNNAVATVNQNGVVTAVGRGSVTIACTAADGMGARATCRITVKQLVSKITFSGSTMNVGVDKTVKLTATIEPSTASNRNVEWTSSNERVATVTSSGYVKGIAKGTAVITCTAKDGSGKKATCTITVVEPVKSIKLNATSKTLLVGKKATLKATVAPGTATVRSVKWTTTNKKVVTVSSKGVIKAVGKGNATVYCEAQDGSGVKASCDVTVKQPVKKLTLNKKSLKLKKGKTYTLKAKISPKNADDKSVKWKTSNKKVVTVSSTGKLTAKKKGTVTITATTKDGSKKTAKCKVKVY